MLKAFLTAQRFFQFLTIYLPFCWMTRDVRKGEGPSPRPTVQREVRFNTQFSNCPQVVAVLVSYRC